jgi:hypothetical protein
MMGWVSVEVSRDPFLPCKEGIMVREASTCRKWPSPEPDLRLSFHKYEK